MAYQKNEENELYEKYIFLDFSSEFRHVRYSSQKSYRQNQVQQTVLHCSFLSHRHVFNPVRKLSNPLKHEEMFCEACTTKKTVTSIHVVFEIP